MDRHDLYERCVQSPLHAVQLLRAVHGHDPRVLAEDFCGTAANSREWVKRAGCVAFATDIDQPTLDRARAHAAASISLVRSDLISGPIPAHHPADVIFVGNFSIGEVHSRADLVRYLTRARMRLQPRGIFVCDTYGGETAFRIGAITRKHAAPDGAIIHYTWEHRAADPATALVENAIHFRVQRGGDIVLDLPDAFVYRWRLWSIPELRDAMIEAGFASTSVHHSLEEVPDSDALPDSYIACVAGRLVMDGCDAG